MAKLAANAQYILRCEGLSAYYELDKPVLEHVSFGLKKGSFHFLTGPSGSGKSTLFSLLSLAMRPAAGKIFLFNDEVTRLPDERMPFLRRKVGMVFQDYKLLNHLTVEENVALPLKIEGVDKATINRNVNEMLEWIGMAPYSRVLPPTLSGGQKQRVAIARAVITKPEIVLADEPTGNLDPELGMRSMKLFEGLHKQGVTVLVATHNEGMVERMGYPILRLKNGHIKQGLPTREASTLSTEFVA